MRPAGRRPRRGSPTSSGSSVIRIVSDHAQARAAARAARQSDGADSPRTGSTSPGPSGTSQVPSSSSPTGSTTGRYGENRSAPSSASWATSQAPPPSTGTNPSGASDCGTVSQKVTPEGATQTARTAGRAGRPCSDQPSRQLAASNECRAGTPSNRFRRAAASTAPSDSVPPMSRSSANWPDRRRLLVRRASAAQANEPMPRTANSGRWSVSSRCEAGASRPTPGRTLVRVRCEVQAPAGPDVVRIDEPRAAAHVAPEVERSQGRPVRPVGQTIVRDAPERLARLHRVRRDVRRPPWRDRDADVAPRVDPGALGGARRRGTRAGAG